MAMLAARRRIKYTRGQHACCCARCCKPRQQVLAEHACVLSDLCSACVRRTLYGSRDASDVLTENLDSAPPDPAPRPPPAVAGEARRRTGRGKPAAAAVVTPSVSSLIIQNLPRSFPRAERGEAAPLKRGRKREEGALQTDTTDREAQCVAMAFHPLGWTVVSPRKARSGGRRPRSEAQPSSPGDSPPQQVRLGACATLPTVVP